MNFRINTSREFTSIEEARAYLIENADTVNVGDIDDLSLYRFGLEVWEQFSAEISSKFYSLLFYAIVNKEVEEVKYLLGKVGDPFKRGNKNSRLIIVKDNDSFYYSQSCPLILSILKSSEEIQDLFWDLTTAKSAQKSLEFFHGDSHFRDVESIGIDVFGLLKKLIEKGAVFNVAYWLLYSINYGATLKGGQDLYNYCIQKGGDIEMLKPEEYTELGDFDEFIEGDCCEESSGPVNTVSMEAC